MDAMNHLNLLLMLCFGRLAYAISPSRRSIMVVVIIVLVFTHLFSHVMHYVCSKIDFSRGLEEDIYSTFFSPLVGL